MSEQQPAEAGAETPATGDQDSSRDTDSTSEKDTDSSTDNSTDNGLDAGEPGEVGDAELPEDLQPHEENPLARHPDQTGDEDDQIGADREEEPETAPLTEEDADYGSGAAG